MKITLPIGYQIQARSARSKTASAITVYASRDVEFEIADYQPQEVHVVAEWHQRFGRHEIPPAAEHVVGGKWSDHFSSDGSLVRLIMVNNRYYAPIHLVEKSPGPAMSPKAVLSDAMISAIMTKGFSYLVDDEPVDMFSPFRKMLEQANYSPYRAIHEVPDLTGKIIEVSTLESVRAKMNAICEDLILVDGAVFREVSEPVLIVRVCREDDEERVWLMVGSRKDYAWPSREMYFPLSQYDVALRHVGEYWPEDRTTISVQNMSVFDPDGLTGDLERVEADRSVRHFVQKTGNILPLIEQNKAILWYQMRDGLRSSSQPLVEEEVDQYCQMVQDFVDQVKDVEDLSADDRMVLRFGSILAERWNLRPLTQGFKFGI